MALAIDSSTPARASATSANVTTASFTPPSSCLLVANVSVTAIITPSITDSFGLIWNTIGVANTTAGTAAAYWAWLPTGTALTVTSGLSGSSFQSLKVYCVTGSTSSPLGGSVTGNSTTTPLTTTGFTVAAAGSFGFVTGTDANHTGTSSSTDTTFDAFHQAFTLDGGSGYKSLGSAGSTATFNLTAGGVSPQWNYVTFEVKAAPPGGVPAPAIPTFANGAVYHAADLNALGSNITNLYSYTMSGFRTYEPITAVRINNTFQVNSGIPTTVQFDTPEIDTNGGFDTFLANSGLQYLAVRTPGIYRLYLQFTMPVGTIETSFTELHICVNGTSISTNSVSGTLMTGRAANTHATVGLSVGNTIYGILTQNTGALQTASLTYGGNYFIAEWISN